MSDVCCASTVHCGCRNLLAATSTMSMVAMGARLAATEAERDALARSLDASASTVALLSAQVGRAEEKLRHALAQLETAESDAADLAAAGLARFDAAMAGESHERLDKGVSPEMVAREHEALARVIQKLSPSIAALRARAEAAEAERDLAHKTISRLNRRAQEAERIALRALRMGLDVVESMRSIAQHWQHVARENHRIGKAWKS